RAAVVDWDVHHGNGTETVFYSDPSVLTISLHQDNLYPTGRGSLADNGKGEGEGYNINIPLPAGSGTGAYEASFDRVVAPALRAYKPDLVIVASGFDASGFDPLGRMMLNSECFRRLAARMVALAAEVSNGRLMMTHEGGYSEGYVPFCGHAVIETLANHRTEVVDPLSDHIDEWAGQNLQPHQAQVIEAAEGLIAGLRQRLASAA
ncbi:MAG: class II histone deacetylase, partial [Mesorhizobium sp.]